MIMFGILHPNEVYSQHSLNTVSRNSAQYSANAFRAPAIPVSSLLSSPSSLLLFSFFPLFLILHQAPNK
jgi:hypothetical protein